MYMYVFVVLLHKFKIVTIVRFGLKINLKMKTWTEKKNTGKGIGIISAKRDESFISNFS